MKSIENRIRSASAKSVLNRRYKTLSVEAKFCTSLSNAIWNSDISSMANSTLTPALPTHPIVIVSSLLVARIKRKAKSHYVLEFYKTDQLKNYSLVRSKCSNSWNLKVKVNMVSFLHPITAFGFFYFNAITLHYRYNSWPSDVTGIVA